MDWMGLVLGSIVMGLYSVGVFAFGWWACAFRWRDDSVMAAHTGKRCDFPGCHRALPATHLRRADGKRRCQAHKAQP